MAPARIPAKVWFLQAFCWVLAATGLMVAALVRERSTAEQSVHEERDRRLEASLREEHARLETLRYQINPHFLFNALNSIRATIPLAETVPREMVTALSDYFRTTLTDPEADVMALRDEIASVEHYLAIEKQRFGDDLQVAVAIAPEVGEQMIPIFLIQPLVENAIHHGFSSPLGRMELMLGARAAGSDLVIEVANSGAWKERGPALRTGIGLDNIRRRLVLLHGDRARLDLSTDHGWVRAIITLPLEDKS
jgi:LytS/YehU family sensor histidine kinase